MIRAAIRNNNEACLLIFQGYNEHAIHLLDTAMRALLLLGEETHTAAVDGSVRQKQEISQFQHNDTYQQAPPESRNHFYYPYNVPDHGMRTFSQPLNMYDQRLISSDGTRSTKSGEATILFNLSLAHSRLGNEIEALSCLEKSLGIQYHRTTMDELFHHRGGGPSICALIHNLGQWYWRNKRYTDALSCYQWALDVLMLKGRNGQHHESEENHRLQLSSTLNCIAIVKHYVGVDDANDIENIFTKALILRLETLSTNVRWDREAATIINNIGNMRFFREEYETALIMYKKAYKHRLAILGENHVDVGVTVIHMAQTEERLGNAKEAINWYERFLSTATLMGGQGVWEVTGVLVNTGWLYDHIGNPKRACKSFSLALDSAKLTFGPNSDTVADIMNKIGKVLYDLGEYDRSLEMFQSGLTIERDHRPPLDETIGATLRNIARVYHRQGKWHQAVESYQEALSIKRHFNDQEGIALILSSLGFIFNEKGEYHQAAGALEEAIAVRRGLERQEFLMYSDFNSLGLAQYNIGSCSLALSSFLEAIECWKRSSGPGQEDILGVHLNAAGVYEAIGRRDKALELYRRMLHLEAEVNTDQTFSKCKRIALLHHRIGVLLQLQGNLEEALQHLEFSSNLCLKFPIVIGGVKAHRILLSLGNLYVQMGNTAKAMEVYAASVNFPDLPQFVIQHNTIMGCSTGNYRLWCRFIRNCNRMNQNPPRTGAAETNSQG